MELQNFKFRLKFHMVYYFLLIFKKRGLSLSYIHYFSYGSIIDKIRLRKYIYVYYFYLGLNAKYYPFFLSKQRPLVEDYLLLLLLDYSTYTHRKYLKDHCKFLYKPGAKFFLKSLVHIYPYNLYYVRIY